MFPKGSWYLEDHHGWSPPFEQNTGRAHQLNNIWSNYSDLTRPHQKWWLSKGNLLISGKSWLVEYYNLRYYHHSSYLSMFLHEIVEHFVETKDFVNSNAPNVTKVLAVAAVNSLQWAIPDHKVGIKWPNDIVGNGHLDQTWTRWWFQIFFLCSPI